MRARNLDRRLDAAGRRVCDRAYERFARLVSGSRPMTPAEEQEADRLFRLLTDLEVRRGTPAAAMLARLPREFANALRAAVRRLLDARAAQRRPGRADTKRKHEDPPCD